MVTDRHKLFQNFRRGKGSRFERGPGLWDSRAQTTDSRIKPRAGTPSPAGTACPFPLSQEVPEGGGGSGLEGGVPAPRGVGVPAQRGVGVSARGVLWPVRGQEAWQYHEPGTPHKPGPLALSQIYLRGYGYKRKSFQIFAGLQIQTWHY